MKEKNHHVTDLKYLDIVPRAAYPKFFNKIIKYMKKHGWVCYTKTLATLLGIGIPKNGIKRYPEHMLKLKDGTKLATDVYLPKRVYKKKGKCPTILVRLPYWKDNFTILGYSYASFGYAVVLQDIRGCAHSEGFNFFLLNEREDGLETLEWISRQYWYNGKIGMVGGSYFGQTQLCVSWDNDLLTCIAPAVSSTKNLWKNHGGLEIQALTTSIYRIMINVVVNREKPLVDFFTKTMFERYLNPKYGLFNAPIKKDLNNLSFTDFKGKSIVDIQEIVKKRYDLKNFDPTKKNIKIYFKFLEDFFIYHKIDRDSENMLGVLDIDYKKISQPVFLLAGWYDMFLEHQLKDFLEIKAHAPEDVKKFSKIVIGSWAHSAVGHPESNLSNSGLGEFYRTFFNKPWFDYWLKDDNRMLEFINTLPLKYWVMGKNIWRYDNNWPPKEIKYENLYIHSQGNANTVKGDGKLSFEEPTSEPKDNFVFDPMNPVITRGGRNLGILSGAHDQKKAENRKDVLVYSTEPLKEGIEVTGPIKMMLHASTSVKDTDFTVKLVDVYPNGRAINILDAGIRARFRNGEDDPSLIEPGKIYKYEINIGNTSNYFRERHGIRIEISSSNFPRFDINSNMGGEGKASDYKIANQEIFHDKEHPSHLIIPIFKK